ncbi:MAG: CvpA family protein [Alloprevotella sp.]|nr:CvpA family protein [Alloprevotella sp.]
MTDIFILAVMIWAAYHGWRDGFLKQVVSSVGVIIGLVVAALCYRTFGEYLSIGGTEMNAFTSVVAFFLLWIIVPIALGFVANVITKTLKVIKLGLFNSLAGTLVSMLKYLILLSCVFNVMSVLHIMDNERTKDSRLYEPVQSVLSIGFRQLSHYVADRQNNSEESSDTIWVDLQPEAAKQ